MHTRLSLYQLLRRVKRKDDLVRRTDYLAKHALLCARCSGAGPRFFLLKLFLAVCSSRVYVVKGNL